MVKFSKELEVEVKYLGNGATKSMSLVKKLVFIVM